MTNGLSVLAEAIRNHIGEPGTDAERAILAVVDKCEQMRAESAAVGWAFADTFEAEIVRYLNCSFPLEQVPEVQRLIGETR